MRVRRRRVLAALGAGSAALAGCLGGGDGGGKTLPAPTLGSEDASVTVAAFTDYACPHCETWDAQVLPKLRSNYVEAGMVHYVHNDFPIPVHPRWSWDAAEASRAVQDRKADAFFEFSHGLYSLRGNFSLSGIESLANDVGVDGAAVVEDVEADVYRPTVEADREDGKNRGVQGTPTVFVDGETVKPTYADVAAAVESASS